MRKSRILRFVIGIISIFLCVGLTQSIINHWQKRSLVNERRQVLKREEERKNELLRRLVEATTSAFIEQEAREKLGLVREEDTIVLLDTSNVPSSDDQSASQEDLSNWKRWWKLFF